MSDNKIPDMPDDDELQEALDRADKVCSWLIPKSKITNCERIVTLAAAIRALRAEIKEEHEKRILLRKAVRDFYDNPYSQEAIEKLWKELEK